MAGEVLRTQPVPDVGPRGAICGVRFGGRRQPLHGHLALVEEGGSHRGKGRSGGEVVPGTEAAGGPLAGEREGRKGSARHG